MNVSCALCRPRRTTLDEVAFLGRSGHWTGREHTLAVANAIGTSVPDFVLHLGDSNYGNQPVGIPGGHPNTLYDALIEPFGSYFTDKLATTFGEEDLAWNYGKSLLNKLPKVERLIAETKKLTTVSEDVLWYRIDQQHVSFFVLNGGNEGSDVRAHFPEQKQWLADEVGKSNMPWKVVVVHRDPYTSLDNAPGDKDLRWDYAGLGIDAVISGHAGGYERLLVPPVHYLTCGTGGAPLFTGIDPATLPVNDDTGVPASQKKILDTYGYLRVQASKTYMRAEFVNIDGKVLDRLVVRKYEPGHSDEPDDLLPGPGLELEGDYLTEVWIPDVATLRTLSPVRHNMTVGVSGAVNPTDGFTKYWRYDARATGDDDGTPYSAVVRPDIVDEKNPGRWAPWP